MKKLKVRILGSGSSGGVPRIGNDWGVCDPNEPKNRRSRCAIYMEQTSDESDGATRVLIDTPPDLREQLLAADVGNLDAVLFSHEHADQCNGIDDLRVIAITQRAQVPVYLDEATKTQLMRRFDYCFVQSPGSSYPAILKIAGILEPLTPIEIAGAGGAIQITPLLQDHGAINSLGFRVGDFAYCNDVVQLPEETLVALSGVKTFVVDALRYAPHPTHAHVDKALEWIERIKPETSVLTNLHVDLDYNTLKSELPKGVEPAFDGMELEVAL